MILTLYLVDLCLNFVKADGWIVEMISLLANPNRVRPKRFWGVYTKLKIFNMTDYKKGNLFLLAFCVYISSGCRNKDGTL